MLEPIAGTPDPADPQHRLIVTTDTLAAIGRYHKAVNDWITAATSCIGAM